MTEADIQLRGPRGPPDEEGSAGGEAEDAPVIKLVHQLIAEAVKARASDIHVEPFENRLRIRYRIDGVCFEQKKIQPPKRLQGPVLTRIKIMAKIDIAEKRKPQDGQIKMSLFGRQLDLRVSTVPSSWGESIVMRILDKGSVLVGVQGLGFEEDDYQVQASSGTERDPPGHGTHGSGKTTTLRGAGGAEPAGRQDHHGRGPVEYHLSGINQCQANGPSSSPSPAS